MRLLVTRPLDEARALARKLEALGHAVLVDPVLEIVPSTDELPMLADIQALLATSANAVRAFAALSPRRDLRLVAVGPATAEVARALGFTKVAEGGGDAARLALFAAESLDPKRGALLHIVGQDSAGDLKGLLERRGFVVRRHVLYVARAAQALSEETQASLSKGALDGVLFFSPRSARIFVKLAAEAALEPALGSVVAFCLSPAIAEAARSATWRDVKSAARPDEEAMLTLIQETQQGPLKP
jgi:uroporphyrinogen-III synthase